MLFVVLRTLLASMTIVEVSLGIVAKVVLVLEMRSFFGLSADAPVQLQSEQQRKSRHDDAIFIESQPMQQQRRPSYRQHEQRRCSRKSGVTYLFCQYLTNIS